MNRLAIVALTMILGACATLPPFTGPKGLSLNPYVIDINWNAADSCIVDSVSEDTTVCQGVFTDFCVGRTDLIIWRSQNPSNRRFEVFFDPLYGARIQSNRKGWVMRPINDEAPVGLYKYSIVGKGCEPNDTNTFDPHIRVED